MADLPQPADAAESSSHAPTSPVEPPRTRRRLRRLARGSVVALALYALLGFQLLPWVLRNQAIAYVHAHYGRTLTLDAVRLHPFALRLELEHVGFPDADGQLLLGLERAEVDFAALASLWTRSYVFDAIAVEQPHVRAIVRRDGSINLADLAPRGDARPTPQPTERDPTPTRVWIHDLTVRDGAVDYIDRARAQPFVQRVAPISFQLDDFRSTPEGGAFKFEADTEQKTHIAWSGDFSLTPVLRSAGRLRVRDLPLTALADSLREPLPFELLSGRVGLSGAYEVSLGAQTKVDLRVPDITLDDLSLRARRGERVEVKVPKVVVRETRVVLHQRRVGIGQLAISGLRTQLAREADGSLNVMRLLPPPRAVTRAVTPAATQPAPAPWAFELARFSVADAALTLSDHTVTPSARLAVRKLDLELGHVGLDLKNAVSLTLDAVLDDGASVHTSGYVTPEPLTAELDLNVAKLPLALAQPYVRQQAALTITDGTLSVHGKARLSPHPEGPRFGAALEVGLRDLKTLDATLGRELFSFRELELAQVRYEQAPAALSIARVRIAGPYARVVLHADQTLNLTDVLKKPAEAHVPKVVVAPRTPVAPVVEARTPDAKPKLRVQVDEVQVDDMRLSFSDQFVKPAFHAELSSLRGALRGVSSDPGARATLRLDGKLGTSAPVSIAGSLQPFAFGDASDVRLAFKNVSLALFNPYSGRFTGYNIRTGELSTDIHYVLRRNDLDAHHKVRIDQLYWGDEASETQAEATLPVKLATALLRDRHGIIQLDLPVQGKLDDPSFRLGPIVWQVVKNLIVKAATAPFALLGNLFRGAEKARYVEFEPGQVEPASSARAELAQLAKALRERPSVTLEVPMGAVAEVDAPALVEQKLAQTLRSLQQRELRGDKKTVPFATLDASDKVDLLEEAYEQLTGEDAELPDAPPAPAGASFRERRAHRRAFEAQQLEQAVRGKIVVERGELEALGQRRAEAIERALTKSGELELSRVLLARSAKAAPEKGKVRLELTLR